MNPVVPFDRWLRALPQLLAHCLCAATRSSPVRKWFWNIPVFLFRQEKSPTSGEWLDEWRR